MEGHGKNQMPIVRAHVQLLAPANLLSQLRGWG